ncbi:MAG TPA: cupin-like domain-containing protein [Allosphingosinicella sp.]|jgi:hypothetical protein
MAEYQRTDRRRFEEEIRPAGQPAVLRGLVADWPAVQATQRSDEELFAYMRGFYNDQPIRAIVGEPEIEGRFFYNADVTELNFRPAASPLGPFLDRLLRDREHPRPYAMAVQSTPVPELLPGMELENRVDLLDADVVPRLWMGNATRVATHYDLKENIGCVVAGRRRFTLFPPGQIGNLYPGPFELTPAGTPVSMVDLAAPDLENYPRFAVALEAAQVAELEPGDAIYIPFQWWHAVDSLAPVNLFINYWWNPAPDFGNPYDALLHGLLTIRNLPDEQRSAWRAMFDHYVFGANGDPTDHLPPHARGFLGASPQDLWRVRATLKQRLGEL